MKGNSGRNRKKKAKQRSIPVSYVNYKITKPEFPMVRVDVAAPDDNVLLPSFVHVVPSVFVDLLKAYNDSIEDLKTTYYLTFGRKKFARFLEFLMGFRRTPPKPSEGIFDVSFDFYSHTANNARLVIRAETPYPITIYYHAPLLISLEDIKELHDYVSHRINMKTKTTTIRDLVQIFIDARRGGYFR